jgi:hypothetical protein
LKPTQAKLPRDQPSSRKMSFCFPVRRALRESAAPQPLAKISRAIPPVSAVTLARVSSAHSAAAVVDAIAAAAVVQTVVVVVPIVATIAARTVVQTADARVGQDSNAVLAVPVARATIVVTAIPARRVVRSSSAKC